MKKSFILLALFSVLVLAQNENYKLVRIPLSSPAVFENLLKLGIDLEHAGMNKDAGSLEVYLSDSEYEEVLAVIPGCEVIIDDWYSYYESLPKMTETEKAKTLAESKSLYNVEGFGYGSMGGYYTFSEIVAQLDSMYLHYPEIITQKFSIGQSVEGRTIWAVKISDNPNVSENEPQMLFDGLIHAREPQSMATVMYYMYYLLENYGTNPEVTYLVNNREIFFVPCTNPDGYEYNRQTSPNGGGMWRKNRRNSGGGAYGVDLNRNYGYMWGYDNNGSSPTPSSETYRGPSAFSEPESQVIRNFALTKNFKTHINYHSYNNSMIYPWGYTNALTPDSAIYVELASYMSNYNGYDYGTSYQTLSYNSNGTARDWMYGEQVAKGKVFSFVFEVGGSSDGFWPPQSRIFPLAQGNLRPNLFLTWIAGEFVNLESSSFDRQYFNPGHIVAFTPKLKNRGFSKANNIQVQLLSTDPYITVINGQALIDSISARSSYLLSSPLTFSISSSAPVDYKAKIVLKTSTSGMEMSSDTIGILLGVPQYKFIDTTNNPTTLWTVTASPSTPAWEATTASFTSAPNSYTDSKTGVYANNATVTLTLKNAIDLTGLNNPKLTFQTKWDIEKKWDCVVVQISSNNGATWNSLQGLYTKPASGSGKQVPAGMPVYEDVKNSWVQEEINLSPYAGQQVKLRFELRTDGSQQRDGFYVDDIGVYVMGLVPVELNSFYAHAYGENKVILKWVTSTEKNNKVFSVQRSENGNDWVTIGYVEGRGTVTEPQSYSYIDNSQLSKTVFYRLLQYDFNGMLTVLPVIEYLPETLLTFTLEQNYPNPFNPETVIRYSIPEKSEVSLRLYDLLGNEIAQLFTGIKEPGNYEQKLDASSLSSGIYIYRLSAGKFSSAKKLSIIK